MSVIRKELTIYAAITRSHGLIDYNVHNDMYKRHEFIQQTVLDDNSLTKDEKTFAIRCFFIGADHYFLPVTANFR